MASEASARCVDAASGRQSQPVVYAEDFDAAVAHLKQRDVKFRIEPLATPVCRMAMIFDPDGNSLCIHKRNPGR